MLTDNPAAPLILIVESDTDSAVLMEVSLQDAAEAYRLEIVGTLHAAHAALAFQAPDLIITSDTLSDGDGMKLVRATDAVCPVIVLLSPDSGLVVEDVLQAGAVECLVTPASVPVTLPLAVKYALKLWAVAAVRKKADEAVHAAKQDWEHTFDAVPDLISIIDTTHTIIRVNRAMAVRCGLSPDELIGRKCHEVMHCSDEPLAFCPHTIMMQTGLEQYRHIEEKRLNGVFDVTVSPLYNREGQLIASVHVARDVTERKQNEIELSEAKGKLQATIDAIPDLLFIVGLDGCYHEFYSPRSDLLAAPVEELIGKKVSEILPPDAADVCMSAIQEAFEKGYSFGKKFELPLPQGTFWFELSVSNMMSRSTLDPRFIVLSRDITERKRAEDEVRESENRYRNLMENVPAIIYRFSTTRGGLFYSTKVEEVFGYPLQTFYDNPLLWKDSIHPDDRASVETYIDTICRDGERGSDVEYRVKNRSGDWLWLRDRLIQREVTDGDVVIFGMAQNITKLKRAELERKTLEAQFQQTQKLESLGVLAGGIAHDFNNILTIILGHCYIVDEEIDSGIDHKQHFKQIERAAGRAADLCRQMLSYAGKNALVQSRINLWMMLDENVKMLQSAIKKNVAIECDFKFNVPEISGDSAQIQQVIMNLIINAAEAIGNNNGTIKISLEKHFVRSGHEHRDFFGTIMPSATYACLTVSDNGCGMDAETQKRIFEPFYTTKLAGRGLGMSAVLGIIKSHNGSLQLSSTLGGGTTFKVYLPVCAGTDVNDFTPTTGLFLPGKGRGTVLLVDDEESIRIIGSALLKAMGFSVMTAPNGRDALDKYREHGSEIDLILLDLMMPVMSGIDTFQALRGINPEIPIVICSGYSVEGIMEELKNDHHAAVIQKPYKPEQLRNTLMKLLEKTEERLQ